MGSKLVIVLTVIASVFAIALDVARHGHFSPTQRRQVLLDHVNSANVTSLVEANAQVDDRTAILTGKVDSVADRAAMTRAALQVPGFLTVYNDVRVDAIDEQLLAELKKVEYADDTPGEFSYRIGPDPHVVTLDGWVPADKPELRQQLEDMVRKIPGVRNVINNIQLGYSELISDINRILQVGNIYFDYNKDTIRPESLPSVEKIAKLLNNEKYKAVRLSIEGHTDSTASRSYNQSLSERRAAAVKQALIGDGVDAARLESRGFGEDRPIAPNVTPEQRANNRRIEFKVIEGTLEPAADVDKLAASPGSDTGPSTSTVLPEPRVKARHRAMKTTAPAHGSAPTGASAASGSSAATR